MGPYAGFDYNLTLCRLKVHRVGRELSFSSVVGIGTSPTPHPQASVPLPPGSGKRGTLPGQRGGGKVPIPTRGHALWCSVYICTLCPSSNTCTMRGNSMPELILSPSQGLRLWPLLKKGVGAGGVSPSPLNKTFPEYQSFCSVVWIGSPHIFGFSKMCIESLYVKLEFFYPGDNPFEFITPTKDVCIAPA